MSRFFAGILVFLAASGNELRAQKSFLGEKAPEIDVRIWIHVEGEPSLHKLRGRPVLLLYWGLRCQVCMCRPVLRKLVPLYKKHAKQGLEILACHIHEATDSEIDVLSMKLGIEFPMGNGGYNAAYDLKQVPMLFLIDAKGVVTWEGNDLGGNFTRKLAEALRHVDYMGETALPKPLVSVRKLVAQRKFGKAIEKLIDFKVNPKHPLEEQRAADAFQKKLEAMGERDFIRGTSAIRTLNPMRGVAILERLALEFKNHPVGRKAIIRLKEVRKDPEVLPLLKAGMVYKQLRDMIKAGNFRVAAAKAQYLFYRYPKSAYARMAANLLEAYDKVD